jgi:hypothetical protein
LAWDVVLATRQAAPTAQPSDVPMLCFSADCVAMRCAVLCCGFGCAVPAGVFSIYWAVAGRPELAGDLATRWTYLQDTFNSNRVSIACNPWHVSNS